MDNSFERIDPTDIQDNIFKLIDEDWMLITAGPLESYNMMTASWGGAGILWNKKIAWCVIRPQRYTREFMEKNDIFTLSFFDEQYRDALNLCGSKSGREINKTEATGFTPISCDLPGATSFKQARMIIECRKIYFQDLQPSNFLDPSIEECYPKKDYHRMYIGEIVNCWIKKKM